MRLRDGPYRAFEIGRGLFEAVIEKLLGERLAGFPDARHAAIARMQRARMQRGAVERHAGCRRRARKTRRTARHCRSESGPRKAARYSSPATRRQRVLVALGGRRRGRYRRACTGRDHRSGAGPGAPGIAGGAAGVIVVRRQRRRSARNSRLLSWCVTSSCSRLSPDGFCTASSRCACCKSVR